MDRSRRGPGTDRGAAASGRPANKRPPSSSRLTVKAKANRRLRQGSIWSRLPKPAVVADACGRAARRSLPALIGAGVLVAVGGTAYGAYRFVTTSSRFAIATIEVRGNEKLSTDTVIATLPAHVGDNMFKTSLTDVVGELRQHPWVATATAHRELPHTLVVEIREHVPAAVVQLGGLYLVDADGHPFKRAELGAEDGAGLPIITGLDRTAYTADPAGTAATVRNALAALGRWRSEPDRPSIGEVHLDPHGAMTLVTYEHAIAIQLGTIDDDLGLRMQTFDATWNELSPNERHRARAIHLDARPDHVTVALHPIALAKDS
jgi:cell division protein FtsQ